MPNPINRDPRYANRDPREVNPRHPLGGVSSELNPTRDHVQGEPEGTTPDANQHTPPAGRRAPQPQPQPQPNEPDPYFYDPTFRP